jgi:uncharacterized protein
MALLMDGATELAATPAAAWAKLMTVDVLKRCIPGCEELVQHSETEFSGVIAIKIGPVKARFKGKVSLSDLRPPHACRIIGEGEGGIAGFARGGCDVKIETVPGGSKLTYSIDATVGGKIAQLGQRLMAGTVKKLADEFFERFRQEIAGYNHVD